MKRLGLRYYGQNIVLMMRVQLCSNTNNDHRLFGRDSNRLRTCLENGLFWKVNNGERVSFWSDRWLEDKLLRSLHDNQAGVMDDNALVREFWLDGQGWDWVRAGDGLSHSSLMRLTSALLLMQDPNVDEVSRRAAKGEEFSVQSTYNLHKGSSMLEVCQRLGLNLGL